MLETQLKEEVILYTEGDYVIKTSYGKTILQIRAIKERRKRHG